jgi:hypothetical protein
MNQYPGQNPYAPPQAPVIDAGYGQAPYGPQSAYVEGKLLVAANGTTLPAMCLKCGSQPHQWKAQKYMYVPPAARLIGWLGILIFGKRSSFQLPLCNGHLAEWKKWNLIAWLATVPTIVAFCVLMAVVGGMDGDAGPIVFFGGIVLVLAELITVLVIRSKKIVMATKIDKTHSWLSGVHPTVLQFVASPQAPQGYGQPQYGQPQVPPQGYGPPPGGGYGPPPGGGYGGPPGGGYGGPPQGGGWQR